METIGIPQKLWVGHYAESERAFATAEEVPVRYATLLAALLSVTVLNGCVLTKLVTLPMRVGGAVVSIVPVVGNDADDAIVDAADTVDDKIPI